MGCNCGGKKKESGPGIGGSSQPKSGSGGTQSFTLTGPGDRVQSFGSELEANAARVRQGNTGRVAPA